MFSQKKLVLFLLLFAGGFASAEAKSQKKFLKELESDKNFQNIFVPWAYRSGVISTAVANVNFSVGPEIESHGFTKKLITTAEGRTHEIYIKADNRPKPLLVFIGGLSSPSSMVAFRSYALPLSQMHRYHIALLENSSSPTWINRNKIVMMSGYEAGWNAYLVIDKLKQLYPVKGIHVTGLSLGGNDALYVAYFDSLLKTNLVTAGFLAWSSPIARLETLHDIRNKRGIPGSIVRSMFDHLLKGAMPVFNEISQKSAEWILYHGTFEELFQQLYRPMLRSYFGLYPHHFSSEPKKIPVAHVNDMENFENYVRLFEVGEILPHIVKPFLWINAFDDPIVDYSLNMKHLAKHKLTDKMGVFSPKNGGHLGFPKSHGAHWIKTVLLKYLKYWDHTEKKAQQGGT